MGKKHSKLTLEEVAELTQLTHCKSGILEFVLSSAPPLSYSRSQRAEPMVSPTHCTAEVTLRWHTYAHKGTGVFFETVLQAA